MSIARWVLDSCAWDGMNGKPAGPPQWRKGRTYMETPNREVEAAAIVRRELGFVGKPEKKKRAELPPAPPQAPVKRRR